MILLLYDSRRVESLNLEPLEFVTNQNFMTANEIKVFVTPDSSFKAMNEAIQAANETIHIAVYQFWSEDIFQLINQTLHEKNTITVKILLEGDTGGYGIDNPDNYSRYYAHKFYQLKNEGFDIDIRLENTGNYLHGKIVIIDSKIVLISSDNFVPTAYPSDPNNMRKIVYYTPSRGWVILIKDASIAQYFNNIFLEDFANAVSYDPSEVGEAPPDYGSLSYTPHFTNSINLSDVYVKPVVSPILSLENISDMILRANHTILIEQMYIKNTTTINEELIQRLKYVHDSKNVTVIIILEDDYPGNYDDMGDYLTSLGFYVAPAFSSGGTGLFLHNKGIIVDDKLVFIGSINWSFTSFERNREFGVIIASRKIASFLREVYAFDWNDSKLSGMENFDDDGDGLPNYYEIEHGLDKNNIDTDGDGFSDYDEVYIYNTDPKTPNYVKTKVFEVYSPINNSYINKTSVLLNVNITNQTELSSIKVYLNGGLYSTFGNVSMINVTISGLYEGSNEIDIIAERSGGTVIDTVKIMINVDLSPPIVNIIRPLNQSTHCITENLTIEWSSTDYSPITKYVIYLNGSKFQETNKKNITINLYDLGFKLGTLGIKIVAIDLAGNNGEESIIIHLKPPEIKSIKIIPNNGSTIAKKEIKIYIEFEIEKVSVDSVKAATDAGSFNLALKSHQDNTWKWEGTIKFGSSGKVDLTLSTDIHTYKLVIQYKLVTNPILAFLYQYGVVILAILVLTVVVIYMAKKR